MKRIFFIAIVAILFSTGCGGGTSGTSATSGDQLNKVFTGIVANDGGTPVPEAIVRLVETNQEVLTDQGGRFFLDVALMDSRATFNVQKGEQRTEFELRNLATESSIVAVNVTLSESVSTAADSELLVQSIDGENCSGLFSTAQVIRFLGDSPPLLLIKQLRSPLDDASCLIHVRLRENGAAREGIEFQLLFVTPGVAGSGSGLQIDPVGVGVTDAAGNGSLAFPLRRERGEGYYVLEAPLSLPESERVGVVIDLLKEVQ